MGPGSDEDMTGDFGPPPPLPEGLKKEVIKAGDQDSYKKPKEGDEVTVDYVGTLDADGTEFDSSHSHDGPFSFTLGKGNVIKGWDLGVPTMKKGEVAKFTMSPEFAYGANGQPPKIPPDATLVFTIELVSWVSKDDLFGDGKVIKALITEGSGWEKPKKNAEVRIDVKATAADKTILEEKTGIDYSIGSQSLGELSTLVNKAISGNPGMMKGEHCALTCVPDYVFEGKGKVVVEIKLDEIYEIADVSLRKDKSVMKKQVKEGDGHEKVEDGRRVTIRVESATDGENPLPGFSGPKELRFISFDGEVCDCLEGAACEMKKGERAVVTCNVPSKCVDAKIGLKEIKADKVVFTIELVDFDKNKREQWSQHEEEKVEVAAMRKESGAKLFKAQRFELALQKYNKVIDGLRDTNKWSDECKEFATELTRASELNKSACLLKLGDNLGCLTTCNVILKYDRNNVKALFRRAKAHYGRTEYVEAIQDLERVLELDPENSEAKTLMPHCKRALKLADTESKSTFSKMCQGFGKLGSGKENKKPETKAVEEEPREQPTTVCVTFRIESNQMEKDGDLKEGEGLSLVGSSSVLGAWDNAKSIEMKLLPPKWEPPIGSGRVIPEKHVWEAIVEVPQEEGRATYKYLVRGADGEDRLEGGDVHKVNVEGMGGSRQRLTDTWRKGPTPVDE